MAGVNFKAVRQGDDKHGVGFFDFLLRNGKKINLPKKMLIDVVEIISGAAFATYTYKSNFHPILPLCFGIMTMDGTVRFCTHLKRFYRLLYRNQKMKMKYFSLLTTGTIAYFATVVAFSKMLKQNNKKWNICLGFAAIGYYISAVINNRLGRILQSEITYLHLNPFYKCFQLLFEPTLIASTAYYLVQVRSHEEKWLRILLLVFSTVNILRVSFAAYKRVQQKSGAKWSLLNGLELLLGGCIININSAVLIIYAINNQLNILVIGVSLFLFSVGSRNISMSLSWFQKGVQMEARVFFCLFNMTRGSIIFFFTWVCFSCINQPMLVPAFVVASGIGLGLLSQAVIELYVYVPREQFNRYCQRVLGPLSTLYCTWVSAYTWRRMGRHFSLATMPLVATGIFMTYRGWR